MVYESDFYTTRRPYGTRPTLTSYSVTRQGPITYYRTIPYVGHKRLTVVTTTPPSRITNRVRPSLILGEIDRIVHKSRPHLAYRPIEDFLNEPSTVWQSPFPLYRSIPYLGIKWLTSLSLPSLWWPYGNITSEHPSLLWNEIDRITRKSRELLAYRPLEKYFTDPPILWRRPLRYRTYTITRILPTTTSYRPSLLWDIDRILYWNRPPYINYRPIFSHPAYATFDDETRLIRAQTNALLRKVHTPLPRTYRPLPLTYHVYNTDFEEPVVIPYRVYDDDYIGRLLGPVRSIQREVESMSRYSEPVRQASIGRGHLACLTYAGGKGYPRRRPDIFFNDDRVKNDVKFLSHYAKNRLAAKDPALAEKTEKIKITEVVEPEPAAS